MRTVMYALAQFHRISVAMGTTAAVFVPFVFVVVVDVPPEPVTGTVTEPEAVEPDAVAPERVTCGNGLPPPPPPQLVVTALHAVPDSTNPLLHVMTHVCALTTPFVTETGLQGMVKSKPVEIPVVILPTPSDAKVEFAKNTKLATMRKNIFFICITKSKKTKTGVLQSLIL